MVKPESVSPGAAVLVSSPMAEVVSSVAAAAPEPWLVGAERAVVLDASLAAAVIYVVRTPACSGAAVLSPPSTRSDVLAALVTVPPEPSSCAVTAMVGSPAVLRNSAVAAVSASRAAVIAVVPRSLGAAVVWTSLASGRAAVVPPGPPGVVEKEACVEAAEPGADSDSAGASAVGISVPGP